MASLVEILIFAVLTVYLFLKLWQVLGTRTGTEKERGFNGDNVIPLRQSSQEKASEALIEGEFSPPLQEAIEKLNKKDRDFSMREFLDGSKKAFQIVIEAFSRGDLRTLKMLLNPYVFGQFEQAVKQREELGYEIETHIEKIDACEPLEISFDKDIVRIQVRLVSDQIIVTRDKDKLILDNPSSMANRLVDIWTFERKISVVDDMWLLSATRSET